ncbi:MAG: EMC3/TMCO1 family protein [Candidatus Atabeyarchaeum deiterrae]
MDPVDVLRTPPLSAIFVILITLTMSLATALITRKVTDQPKLQRYRREIAEWRRMMNEAKKTGNEKLALEVRRRSKIVEHMQKQMASQSIRPLLIYIIPFFIVFAVLNGFFGVNTVAAIPWNLGLLKPIPLLGTFIMGVSSGMGNGGSIYGLTYFGWYLFCSFSFGMMVNKLLGVNVTGTGIGGPTGLGTR